MASSRYRIHAALTCVMLLTGCVGKSENGESAKPPADAFVIRGAGSSFAAPLYRKWSATYRRVHPKVWIEYDSVGSGEGQDRFIKGTVDFGASDALLSSEQDAQVDGGVISIPIAAGGIAIAYNPADLPNGIRLTREVVAGIFFEKIKYWNDPKIVAANPGVSLPKVSISPIVRSDASGTTYAFTSHLSAVNAEWRAGPGAGKSVKWPGKFMQASGNERVAGTVKQTHGGVSYVEVGTARVGGLHMAAVENKAGEFIIPSDESIQLAAAMLSATGEASNADPAGRGVYPIVTSTYLLVRKKALDPKRAEELGRFAHWCVTEGQSACEPLGFVRISPETTALALKNADSIGRE